MIFIDLISWILFIFLACFVLVQIYIISCSSRGRIIDIEKRSYVPKYQQNINVIVYSHNDSSTIVDLVESLKKQDYDADKYSINIILDNCEDNSAKLLEILGGTRLWRINTDIKPIGRNKAIAWLLERILSNENTNAFVFINAHHVVRQDFLSKVNTAIFDNPVVTGEELPLNSNPGLGAWLAIVKNKIKNRVFNHGRYYANFGNIMDQEVCAIRQDILEKISFSITDYGYEEYEFSVKLARYGIPILHTSQIQCFRQFTETITDLAMDVYKKRYKNLVTFRNNFVLLFSKKGKRTKELLLSLIYPSGTVFAVLAVMLLSISVLTHGTFAKLVGAKIILLLIFGYLFGEIFSMLVARCSFKEYKYGFIWVFIEPYVFILSLFQGLQLKMSFKFSLPKKLLVNKDMHKQVIETTISDGNKELPCKIEIRQNNSNTQVFFIFNEKKLSSSRQNHVNLALEEVLEKLRSHGFNLKVCLNCGYFKMDSKAALKFAGEQGYCLFDNVNKGSKALEYTYIWNSCENMISVKLRNHVMERFEKIETEPAE